MVRTHASRAEGLRFESDSIRGGARGGLEGAIAPCRNILQSWTKYIETTTKIQVELMNPQLRLRTGIF